MENILGMVRLILLLFICTILFLPVVAGVFGVVTTIKNGRNNQNRQFLNQGPTSSDIRAFLANHSVQYPQQTEGTIKPIIKNEEKINNKKLDINNCTEEDLEKLPGISLIHAKKLIKRREEIQGFKSVEDVFLFLKLNENMQERIRDLICVNPIENIIIDNKTDERNVDL